MSTPKSAIFLLDLLITCFDEAYVTSEQKNTLLPQAKDPRIVYSFGLQYWYKNKWRNEFANSKQKVMIQSHYDNFKDELIDCEGKIFLSVNRWNEEIEIAIINQQRNECKQNCITTTSAIPFYIQSNTLITIQHLIALQLWCNTTTERLRLSDSYRFVRYNEGNNETIDDTIEDIAKEHSYYANWGRLLFEAVNIFGNRQWKHKYFYHAFDKEILFKQTTFIYIYAPLNTTTDISLTMENTCTCGMIIKIDATMNNCFDCNWISDKNEHEYLFIGSMNPFRIANVWLHRKSWISMANYMTAINEIIADDMQQKIDEITQENECSIKEKVLQIKDEILGLSVDELQNNLDIFSYKIIENEYSDDEAQLSAVGWILKLFHCYLSQNLSLYN